ncbi:MAG TPA: LysR family transcriptional regulator [Bryobacteraceae bacterium]|nr:LysR family transcriptional regulator [Bryobacteraceae bacterium]
MLDFELLRAFVAVADRGGFHRAAERLNLTGTGEPRIPARRHRWEAAPKVRFAQDSLLEGDGFELPVPRELISAGSRNPAASGSTSALDGATRAQLGGAERTVARKWRKPGFSRRFAMRRA